MNWRESARSAFHTIIGHHWNEAATIDRAATAKAWGLDPVRYATPYTQQTITNNAQGSSLLPMLLGAVLGTSVLGGGIWLGSLLKPAVETKIEKTVEQWDSKVDMKVEPPEGNQ